MMRSTVSGRALIQRIASRPERPSNKCSIGWAGSQTSRRSSRSVRYQSRQQLGVRRGFGVQQFLAKSRKARHRVHIRLGTTRSRNACSASSPCEPAPKPDLTSDRPQLLDILKEISFWVGSRSVPIGTPTSGVLADDFSNFAAVVAGVPLRC